jgi:hypothetical protein
MVKAKRTKPPVKRGPRKSPREKHDMIVNILLTPPELEKIDDFRTKHRFNSRNEAMRRLLAFALKETAKIPALPL